MTVRTSSVSVKEYRDTDTEGATDMATLAEHAEAHTEAVRLGQTLRDARRHADSALAELPEFLPELRSAALDLLARLDRAIARQDQTVAHAGDAAAAAFDTAF